MTFEDAPTYEDKASLAPITVRSTSRPVQAMHFPGGAEAATRIIDWVLLNNGTASWMESQPEIRDDDGTLLIPYDPERIFLHVPQGGQRVRPGNWVVQFTDGSFYALTDSLFRENHLFN